MLRMYSMAGEAAGEKSMEDGKEAWPRWVSGAEDVGRGKWLTREVNEERIEAWRRRPAMRVTRAL